jgi:hypothetical protein
MADWFEKGGHVLLGEILHGAGSMPGRYAPGSRSSQHVETHLDTPTEADLVAYQREFIRTIAGPRNEVAMARGQRVMRAVAPAAYFAVEMLRAQR